MCSSCCVQGFSQIALSASFTLRQKESWESYLLLAPRGGGGELALLPPSLYRLDSLHLDMWHLLLPTVLSQDGQKQVRHRRRVNRGLLRPWV